MSSDILLKKIMAWQFLFPLRSYCPRAGCAKTSSVLSCYAKQLRIWIGLARRRVRSQISFRYLSLARHQSVVIIQFQLRSARAFQMNFQLKRIFVVAAKSDIKIVFRDYAAFYFNR